MKKKNAIDFSVLSEAFWNIFHERMTLLLDFVIVFFFNLLRWNKTDHSQNGMVLSSFLDWFLKEVVSKKLLIYNTEIDADCRHGGLHQIVTGSLLHWVVCKSTKKFTCKSVDFY